MRSTQRRRSLTAVLVASAATLLAACGTTEPAAEPSTSSASSSSAAASGPIEVTDGRGEKVTLEAPATKVVTLEWQQTEAVVSLGVDPIGASDVAGYTSWVGTAVPFRTEPTDVGVRQEPSIETIATLEPDLIIGSIGSIPDSAMEQMSRIAPIMLMKGSDANDQLGLMTTEFQQIAKALGKDSEGEEVLATYDAAVATAKEALAAADLAGAPVVLATPYADGANVQIRMHGPRTTMQAVALEVGLGTAWEDPGDDGWGLSYADVEGLSKLPADTRFIYWGNGAEADDESLALLEKSPLWQNYEFVKQDHVYRGAVGIWAYGGPASMTAWANDLVALLTK